MYCETMLIPATMTNSMTPATNSTSTVLSDALPYWVAIRLVSVAFASKMSNSGSANCVPEAMIAATAIVSPMARPRPRMTAAEMPENAAGMEMLFIVCHSVAPMATEPSPIDWGTRSVCPRETETTVGSAITPTTIPDDEVARPVTTKSTGEAAQQMKADEAVDDGGDTGQNLHAGLDQFPRRSLATSAMNSAPNRRSGPATAPAMMDPTTAPNIGVSEYAPLRGFQ